MLLCGPWLMHASSQIACVAYGCCEAVVWLMADACELTDSLCGLWLL